MNEPATRELAIWKSELALTVVVFGLIALVPALQARRRGYSGILWFLTGLLARSPIFLLILLAAAPHQARRRKRDQYLKELDALLAARPAAPTVAAAGAAAPERSVGDQPTVLPRDRSVGDLETRG
jgi:hypothetical protein